MTFKQLDWTDPAGFQDNLLNLAYNIFKVQFFYEEDQLPKLSRHITDDRRRTQLLLAYQEAADEANVYLKTIQAFRMGKAKLPQNSDYFQYLLEYFESKEKELLNFEIENEARFKSWLENGEYISLV